MKRLCSLAALAIALCGASTTFGQEPDLETILKRQGYGIDLKEDEIRKPFFKKTATGRVKYYPIASWGPPEDVHSGWYVVQDGKAKRVRLWSVAGEHNQEDKPPTKQGDVEFDPKDQVFGLYVEATAFEGEVVYSEDRRQKAIKRFGDDLHKAHVYPVKTARGVVSNAYLICWEFSTNNDNQDIVTRIENVELLADRQ